MTLFKNQTHQDIWISHHCERCYFLTSHLGCKILTGALKTGRKPVEWDRNPRKNATMAESIKCNSETRLPPRDVKHSINIDVPMFEVQARWRKGDEPDHA